MRRRALLLLPLLLAGCASSSPNPYSLDLRPGPVREGVRRMVLVRSPGGPVAFEGYAAIAGPGRPHALDRLHVEGPAGADTTEAQVDATGTALGQVADAIARRLP